MSYETEYVAATIALMTAELATLRAENEALREQIASIRDETLEEAAKVADDEDGHFTWAGMDRNVVMLRTCASEIAAAIRALQTKEKTNG